MAGLPDFLGTIYHNGKICIPNDHKGYQMTTKYTKWPQNTPKGLKSQIAVEYNEILHPTTSKYVYPNLDL
jgi:hypothetical protein